jgi:DNA-binding response OmpR family regulator
MRLLCVEDEAPLREDIVEYLRMQSYEVDEAECGEDAIDQMNRHDYDLILCDIKMPRMDGYDLLSQVRQVDGYTHTPFIFLTAYGEREDRIRAHTIGCDAFITKPVDMKVLDAMLKAHVERSRARAHTSYQMLQASHNHTMCVLDDALNGSLSDISMLLIDLQERQPHLLLSATQEKVMQHTSSLHAYYSALQLQSGSYHIEEESCVLENLIKAAVDEARQYNSDALVYYQSKQRFPSLLHGDPRLLRRVLSGLYGAILHATSSAECTDVIAGEGVVRLTVCDHPAMLDDPDYIAIAEATDLSNVAHAVRDRLVTIVFAMQVAHIHRGRIELCLWPENQLAVRLILPQTTQE